jgi:hypothetical protein
MYLTFKFIFIWFYFHGVYTFIYFIFFELVSVLLRSHVLGIDNKTKNKKGYVIYLFIFYLE